MQCFAGLQPKAPNAARRSGLVALYFSSRLPPRAHKRDHTMSAPSRSPSARSSISILVVEARFLEVVDEDSQLRLGDRAKGCARRLV
jgi:hypothetical protein